MKAPATMFALAVGISVIWGAVGAALVFWSRGGLSQPAIALIGVVVAIALGVVGIFRESIRDAVHGPLLTLSFDPGNRSDVTVTLGIDPASGKATGSVAYVRLRVGNEGGTAKNVEVIARRAWLLSEGAPEPLPAYVPMNLRWSYTGDAYMPQIPKGVEKYIDLLQIIDPRRVRPDVAVAFSRRLGRS